MFRLRFTTMVEAPLTVAFDVARTLGRPWGAPLEEVVSVRPVRDVYARRAGSRPALADPLPAVHRDRRGHPGRRAGGLGDRRCPACWAASSTGCCAGGCCGRCRPTSTPTRRRPTARGARRGPGGGRGGRRRAAGCSSPSGPAAPTTAAGSSRAARSSRGRPTCRRWSARSREELGIGIVPQDFLGEVVLDGSVGGGPPGTSTLRRLAGPARRGGARGAGARRSCAGCGRTSSDELDWIAADRPLLPAVRAAPALTCDGRRPPEGTASVVAPSRARPEPAKGGEEGVLLYLKTSLTFSPACLRLPLTWSALPSAWRSRSRSLRLRLPCPCRPAPRSCSWPCRCRSSGPPPIGGALASALPARRPGTHTSRSGGICPVPEGLGGKGSRRGGRAGSES